MTTVEERRELPQLDEERLLSLHEIGSLTFTGGSLHEKMEQAAQIIAKAASVDVCSIFLREGNEFVMRATWGLPQYLVGSFTVAEGVGIAGVAAARKETVLVADARADERFYQPGRLPVIDVPEDKYQSVACFPIMNRPRQEVLGVLSVQNHTRTEFDLGTQRYLEVVATQLAISLQNVRLHEQTDERLQEKVRQLTALQTITTAMASRLDPNDLAQSVVDEAYTLFGVTLAVVARVVEQANGPTLTIPTYRGDVPFRMQPGITWDGPIGEAIKTGRVIRISEIGSEGYTHWSMVRSWAMLNNLHAVAALPLTARGRILGALGVYKNEAHEWTDEEIGLLSAFATQTAIFLDNAQLYQDAQVSNQVKSTLLSEMHHRVKNNLATIAGLLNLQAKDVRSPEAMGPLTESVQRIHSIAMVHDLLSREDIGQTSLADVAGRMVEMARTNLLPRNSRVRFETDVEDITVASQQATSLALILNELISNALHHGLRDGAEGVVSVRGVRGAGRVTIVVTDNGQGLPADFTMATHSHLGLQIVQTLARSDLRGDMVVERLEPGTRVTVVFPLALP